MSSSNNDNSANNANAQGLEAETRENASTGIPTQHGAIISGQQAPRTRSQTGSSTPRVITDHNENELPTTSRRRRRRANGRNNNSESIPQTTTSERTPTMEDINELRNLIIQLANRRDYSNNDSTSNSSENSQDQDESTNHGHTDRSIHHHHHHHNHREKKIPYSEITSANFTNYNINWSKFNIIKYNDERFQNKTVLDAIKQLSRPSINYSDPSAVDPITFLDWYQEFKDCMITIGLDNFLFKEEFTNDMTNPVQVSEERYIRTSILHQLFPDDYRDMRNSSNCTELFEALKNKYFPEHPGEIANQLLRDLDVSYTCNTARINTTYNIIKKLNELNHDPIMLEKSYISHVMDIAQRHFAASFASIYDEWKLHPEQYTLSKIRAILNHHIKSTPTHLKDSVPATTRAHEMNNIHFQKDFSSKQYNNPKDKYNRQSQSYKGYKKGKRYYGNKRNNHKYNRKNYQRQQETFNTDKQAKSNHKKNINMIAQPIPTPEIQTIEPVTKWNEPKDEDTIQPSFNGMIDYNINAIHKDLNNYMMFDNGAKVSVTTQPELLHSIKYNDDEIQTFTKDTIPIIGSGIYDLYLGNHVIHLSVFLLEPPYQMHFPLIISEQTLCETYHIGLNSHYDSDKCYIFNLDTQEKLCKYSKINGYSVLPIKQPLVVHHISSTTKVMGNIHKICGHFNQRKIRKLIQGKSAERKIMLSKNQTQDILRSLKEEHTCEACLQSKPSKHHEKAPYLTQLTHPLERVSADLLYLGYKYFLIIIDHYTSFIWTYELKSKAETSNTIDLYLKSISNHFPQYKLETLLTDNGSEFYNTKMEKLINDYGIKRIHMPTYTPAINGKVERANRTIIEGTRALLLDTNVPIRFIGYAVQYITEWYNLLPQGRNDESPRELLYGRSTISSQIFHPFGTTVSYLQGDNRGGKSKLEPVTHIGAYLGFRIDKIIGHIIYDGLSNRFIYSTHTYFSHNTPYFTKDNNTDTIIQQTPLKRRNDTSESTINNIHQSHNKQAKVSSNIPTNPQPSEAVKYVEWREAMKMELLNHENNDTFTITRKPPHTMLIPLTWVLTTKVNKNNEIVKYKARMVAAGNREKKDKKESIASPTSDQALVKIIITIALQFNWKIHQADVTAAYLHADINKELYMRFPPYGQLFIPDFNPATQCLKLNKSLYGLRVSGLNWYNHFAHTLSTIGFHSINTSDTIFIRKRFTEKVICLLYVDDCLITGSNELLITQAIQDIQKAKVKLNDMGELEQFLGVNYERTGPHTMEISRTYKMKQLTEDSLPKFDTPSYQEYLTDEDMNNSTSRKFPIRSIIGEILYTALTTRPDLTYATTYLTHFLDHTNEATWRFTQRLQSYYQANQNLKLTMNSSATTDDSFKIYCDSDYASDPITRHSQGGYIAYYNNIPILWRSKQSQRVCTSSTHAELDAAFNAVQSCRWLFQTINDLRSQLGDKPYDTIHLYQDNTSTITILQKEYYPIKNWDVRYKYLYELVQLGEVTLHYIPTNEMIADIFTKPLPINTFHTHRNTLGIH